MKTQADVLTKLMRRCMARIAPPPRISVAKWAERYRVLAENTALPGRFSLQITPFLRGVLEAINDRRVRKVVCQKSAQVGWTDGVMNNFIGYVIHIDPSSMAIMFPREATYKKYAELKLEPMIDATPVLRPLVNLKSRSADNKQDLKQFPGGFLMLFGSNSTDGVKSTPIKRVCVEEPDDCNLNIKGQGDSIKLAEERVKSFHDSKILIGGTPTVAGISAIAQEMQASDQRSFWVPCHDCGEAHVLNWDNVHWQQADDGAPVHAVFGAARPETAHYACPHCGSLWNDAQKNRNVRRAEDQGFGWKSAADFHGVAGFYLNELYSSFPDSTLTRLVEKFLTAEHEATTGELGAKIAFWNSTLGLPWEYQSDMPKADALSTRAEAYDEFTVPWGGLILTAGVDVQHDRLAVVIRAWGRGEESWLVYWGEIFGSTLVPTAGAWVDLDQLLGRDFVHASGSTLRVRAVSIDGSDGNRTEIVHAYVRPRRARGFMTVKGAAEQTDDRREIFSTPKKVDTNARNKPSKFGLDTYIVGTARAKDLILENRLLLEGHGGGALHWYAKVRPDYWEQLVSEVKAPSRTNRYRKAWQKLAGVRNEALDCEVYALHAARSVKTNLMRDAHWGAIEARMRQRSLIDPVVDDAVVISETPAESEAASEPMVAPVVSQRNDPPTPTPASQQPQAATPAPRKSVRRGPGSRGGFAVNSW
ncbi:MAG: phage terminase large subunit family protein [Leptothrix sp. (in: b-proteobacteria)]